MTLNSYRCKTRQETMCGGLLINLSVFLFRTFGLSQKYHPPVGGQGSIKISGFLQVGLITACPDMPGQYKPHLHTSQH